MKAMRKIIENAQERIFIEVPEELRNQKLEVIVLAADAPMEQGDEHQKSTSGKYDFSDIIGKFKWEGDALAEQRKLRDEWD